MTKWKKWTTLDKIGNIEKFDKVDKNEKFDKIAMKNNRYVGARLGCCNLPFVC